MAHWLPSTINEYPTAYHLVGGTGQTEPPPSQEGLMSANKLKGKKIRAKKMGKPKNQELTNFYLGGEDPLEEGMVTYSSFWPAESHGQRSLESDRVTG